MDHPPADDRWVLSWDWQQEPSLELARFVHPGPLARFPPHWEDGAGDWHLEWFDDQSRFWH